MAGDPDPADVVTVTTDGVTVEKRFTVDEFPVPAVKFVLSSEADEAVEIRLTDEIPESFDMEGIGFHPEYDGDGWTAYRDHRVEYERTVDPGEEVTTVYGVRADDPGTGDRFLDEPTLESLSPDEDRATPDDVLGRETTQAVRDALSGGGDLAEGEGDEGDSADTTLDLADPTAPDDADLAEPESEATLDLADPAGSADAQGGDERKGDGDEEVVSASDEDVDLDVEGDEAVDADDEDGAAVDGAESTTADGPAAPRSLDDDLTPVVNVSEGAAVGTEPAPDDAASGGDADGAADGESGGAPAVEGSVVAALAEEIRAGEVDDDDLAALRDALDAGVPRSVEVRIDRLQNRTDDLAAYADALEEFIDEEGTAREVLDGLDAETTALREDLDAVEDELDVAAEERDDLAAATGAHDERLSEVESDLTAVESELDAVRASVDEVERSVEDLAGDTDEDLGAVQDTLDDVEATVADLEDELEDLQSFRERMREALGT